MLMNSLLVLHHLPRWEPVEEDEVLQTLEVHSLGEVQMRVQMVLLQNVEVEFEMEPFFVLHCIVGLGDLCYNLEARWLSLAFELELREEAVHYLMLDLLGLLNCQAQETFLPSPRFGCHLEPAFVTVVGYYL